MHSKTETTLVCFVITFIRQVQKQVKNGPVSLAIPTLFLSLPDKLDVIRNQHGILYMCTCLLCVNVNLISYCTIHVVLVYRSGSMSIHLPLRTVSKFSIERMVANHI